MVKIMNRQRSLADWPISDMGGPELNNSDDAILYARIAYNNHESIASLILQKQNLNKANLDIMTLDPEDFETRTDIAFKMQFTNDAIREIKRIVILRILGNGFSCFETQSCPFCAQNFLDHDEYGNCPLF